MCVLCDFFDVLAFLHSNLTRRSCSERTCTRSGRIRLSGSRVEALRTRVESNRRIRRELVGRSVVVQAIARASCQVFPSAGEEAARRRHCRVLCIDDGSRRCTEHVQGLFCIVGMLRAFKQLRFLCFWRQSFWRFLLRSDLPSDSLDSLNFAVFGLGRC